MTPDVIAAGLLAGGLYALIGLGVSLVFGVLGVMNLAHGELVIGGAYVVLTLVGATGVPPLALLPVAMLVAALIAFPLQRVLLTPLLQRSKTAPLVATFGLSLLAQALYQAVFDVHPKTLESTLATSGTTVLGVRVQSIYLVGFAISVVLLACTYLVLNRTRAGSAVRAVSADARTASLLGINVGLVYGLTFAAAAALAAAGGVIIGIAQSFTPTSGLPIVLTGLAVMALAGIGSVGGVLIAGLFLGLVQSISVSYLGGGLQNTVVYLVFFVALAVFPRGVFGKDGLLRFGVVLRRRWAS